MKYLSLWNFNDISESLAKFKSEFETSLNLEDRDLITTQIARCYGLKKEFDQAGDTLLNVGENLDSKSALVRAYYFIELGRILNSASKAKEAIPYFLKSLEISEKEGSALMPVRVDALHMMAIADPAKAIKWDDEAFQLVERSHDTAVTKWKASLCNNLGWSFFKEKDYEQALDFFTLALSERVTRHEQKEVTTARWCVARVHRQLCNWDQALHMQEHNLRESPEDHFVHEELALIYSAFKNTQAAKLHAKRALQSLEQDSWLVKNEPERLLALKRLIAIT